MRNFGEHAHRYASAHASDHRIQFHLLEILSVRFGADPIIPQKHHGFFAVFVNDIDQAAHRFRNFSLDEIHPIQKFFVRNAERIIITASVDKIFRAKAVTVFFCKFLQPCRRRGHTVTEPIHIFFFSLLVKNESELIQKSREPHHVCFRMRGAPFPHMLTDVNRRIRKSRIVHTLLGARPFIGKVIIDLNRVPKHFCHKIDGVLVHGLRIANRDRSVLFIGRPF